jgi:predicted ArsR family transcriptional regulator
MSKELTILEVSQKLGCTKAAIRFHLPKLSLDMIIKQQNGTILISEDGIQKLETLVNKEPNQHNKNDFYSKAIDSLTEQLTRKDEQLTRKDEQIDQLTKLLDQQQRLQAASAQQLPGKKSKWFGWFKKKD